MSTRRSTTAKKLEAQGWEIGQRRRHPFAVHPDAPGQRVWLASTPSDHRAERNALAQARRTLRQAQEA